MKPENSIVFDHRPEPLEQKVRAVCGAVLGAFVGWGVCLKFSPLSTGMTIVVAVGCIVACAALAVRYGDSFWYRLFETLRYLL